MLVADRDRLGLRVAACLQAIAADPSDAAVGRLPQLAAGAVALGDDDRLAESTAVTLRIETEASRPDNLAVGDRPILRGAVAARVQDNRHAVGGTPIAHVEALAAEAEDVGMHREGGRERDHRRENDA